MQICIEGNKTLVYFCVVYSPEREKKCLFLLDQCSVPGAGMFYSRHFISADSHMLIA